jgi:uncharacterized membrane protein YkoI
MFNTLRKPALALAAIGAFGLGGATLAGAADNNSNTTQSKEQRPARQALSSDVAAKVKAAAVEKVPGATVLRTEAGGPYKSAYHAHIKTSDGTRKVVLVNSDFEATSVQADKGRPGGRGPGGPRGAHKPESALTGDTKEQVEAAVKSKYPGATIDRTETNTDGSAPYESHITTTDGKHLEVLVSKDYAVVGTHEMPARP